VQGVRYFNVKVNYGLFVTINTCIVLESAPSSSSSAATAAAAAPLSRIPSQKRLGVGKAEAAKTSSIKKPLVTQSVQRQPSSRTGLAVPGSGSAGEAPKTSSVKRLPVPKLATSSSSSNLTGGSVKRVPVKRTDTGLGSLAATGRSSSSTTGLHRKSPSVGGMSLHAPSSAHGGGGSGTPTPTASPPPEPDSPSQSIGDDNDTSPAAAPSSSLPLPIAAPHPLASTSTPPRHRLAASTPPAPLHGSGGVSIPLTAHSAPPAVMSPTPIIPLTAGGPQVTINSTLPVSSTSLSRVDSPAPIVATAPAAALPTAGVLGLPTGVSSSSTPSPPDEPSSPIAPTGGARFADDEEDGDKQTPLPDHDTLQSGSSHQGSEITSPVVARARQMLLDKKMKQKAAKQRTLKGVANMALLAAQFAAEANEDSSLSSLAPSDVTASVVPPASSLSSSVPSGVASGSSLSTTPEKDIRRRSVVALDFAAERSDWERKLTAANHQIATLQSQLKGNEDKLKEVETRGRATAAAGDATLTAKIHDLELKLAAAIKQTASLESQVTEAQGATEMAVLDKSMAEELVAEAKAQTSAAEQKYEAAAAEIESLKEQILDAGKNALAALPKTSEDAAKMVDDNKRLAAALIKLRDQSLAEKTKLESIVRRLEGDVKEGKEYEAQLNVLRPQFEAANSQIADLKTALDESSSLEGMVTTLTEQAVELKSELEQLRDSNKNLQELVDASDEVEEGHVELEQQLQRELDAKASELNHYKVASSACHSIVLCHM
jgi:predicted  nucleic acid-binding Zn-ribbon protein